ncbi:MAG: transposase domain-containing protein [Sphaerochaetaceae bacterium]
MYVDVKTIAEAIGKTPRSIQIRAKNGEFSWRKKDGRSIEILVSSLPSDWQAALAKKGAIAPSIQSIRALAPMAQEVTMMSMPILLGKKATETQLKRREIALYLKRKPDHVTQSMWYNKVADYFDVSVSTVYRIVKNQKEFGVVGKPRKAGRTTSFDSEAISWIKGYLLQAEKEHGYCSKTTAWKALQVQADNKGWKIGSRATAFRLLDDIDPLLRLFAVGGNRALDNHFFIRRDCTVMDPMQVVIGDQHIFDWWVADYTTGEIFRPECYLWEDHATKLIYGIAFDRTYSSHTVKESLRLGLNRFGAFDCTYNDNGSSETSKAINSIIDDLFQLQMDAQDISELYRTQDGVFVVMDEDEEEVLDVARSEAEWRKKHRRIFANVKNAKAKDIERFFRTLEGRLDARMLPGRVATPGANAAVDEVERARLDRQKEKCELLTVEQFMLVVLEELDAYEHEYHGTLKMSPLEMLEKKVAEGWHPRFFEPAVIDMIMFDRTRRKVDRGYVTIDKVTFVGEELRAESGSLADVGLWRYDGKTVELRYNRHDLSHAYAIVDGHPRPLKAVHKISNLDDDAMSEQIALKRRQMAAVREAFKTLTAPIGGLTMRSEYGEVVRQAQKVQKELPETFDVNLEEEVQKQIADTRKPKVVPLKPLHAAPYERYKWCLDMKIRNIALDQEDERFFARYRRSPEYKENQRYWETYERLGGDA